MADANFADSAIDGADRCRPVKILHVSTISRTLAFLDGQIAALQRAGFKVLLAAAPDEFLTRFGSDQNCPFFPISWERRITPAADLIALWRLMMLLRRIRPDIVHAHTPKAGLLGMLAARISGVPIRIFHLHGLPHTTRTGAQGFILQVATTLACRCSTRVIAVSRSVAQSASDDRLCPAGKIDIFGQGSVNGVDAAHRFHPERFIGERWRIR